jgi:hypothetical protein
MHIHKRNTAFLTTMAKARQATKATSTMEPTRYSYSYRRQSGLTRTLILLSLLQALLSGPTAVVVGAKLVSASPYPSRFSSGTTVGVIYRVRGGAESESSKNKKKNKSAASAAAAPTKKKKKTTSDSASTSKDKKKKKIASAATKKRKAPTTDAPTNKKEIDKILKEKDAAQVLGDAIRDRAEQLRQESPIFERVDQSVASVGWALGASDRRLIEEPADDAAGGVEAAPTSVLMYYFLKSHGGAHALQCVCSLMATIAGLGSMLLPCTSPLCLTLMKRCMLFAMVKHVSGLLATTFLTARAIPDVGFREARVWMEQLAIDPVSQYVFYAACTILWLPEHLPAPTDGTLWWQAYPMIPSLLVGPVVLREIISIALVLSDVLVLSICGSEEGDNRAVKMLLSISQSFLNAVMSILVTPKLWRSANAAKRQEILAKLTSKLSLALEVLVGLLFTADAGKGVIEFSFASLAQRPPFLQLVKRLICTRLYLHFLWTRRRKISRLATTIRGGAGKLPLYFLDVLNDPRSSLGLPEQASSNKLTWKDYIALGLGFDSN